jgi:choline dehydrogenase-like flavoprotein
MAGSNSYDVIVIGGGHNGLVNSAYLARAGKKVLVLERRHVLGHLVDDVIRRGNQQTAGDIGYHYLVRALMEGGRSDLLFAMTNRTDPPSYGAQLARGATSLTEAWDADPASSQNHCMLGHIEEWFYAGLAGIEADSEHITIKPQPVGDLTWVKAWHDTVHGRVESSWKKDAAGFEFSEPDPDLLLSQTGDP